MLVVKINKEHTLFSVFIASVQSTDILLSASELEHATFCTYAMTMTQKSSQFHGSLRKVNLPTQKPRARILISDSNVYIPVKVYL